MKVTIICGGLTHERDVSLRSGRRVAESLRHLGHDVDVLDVNSELILTLQSSRPDVVWPLVHGSVGEDGSLQAVLDLLGLPYVGSDAAGAMLTIYKPSAKEMVRRAGISTPPAVALPRVLFQQLGATGVVDALMERFPFPVVVKPAEGGSSLGVTVARNQDELRIGLVNAFSYGETAMIEAFVVGKEVAVSVICTEEGPQPLPAVEIVTDGVYDYDARYNAGRSEYFVPARLTDAERANAEAAAVGTHLALGLRDYSRTDLLIDANGCAQVIDCNTSPGMTDTSLFPLAATAERGFDEMVGFLVERAAARGGSVVDVAAGEYAEPAGDSLAGSQ
ncbi:MAG: D-alanine--D-alanine ligase [Buchananella hordeovulneris]|nr:D-alanine--D-alanine ligase [Buchananella hordeovulneris]